MDFYDHLFARKPLPRPPRLDYDPDTRRGVLYAAPRAPYVTFRIVPVDQFVFRGFVGGTA